MPADQTVIFHSTIFGPIHSRRLGASLGVNLMPADGKICSFDCLYCEAGFNAQGHGKAGLPAREEVARLLENRLRELRDAGDPLDVITFSGNGEPTLHPEFEGLIDDTLRLRDKYFPNAKVSVLTNSTRIFDPAVARALKRVDNNILKLDSAVEGTMRALDRPASPDFTVDRVVDALCQFEGTGIIQTMLVKGTFDGRSFDNTSPEEIQALIDVYKRIRPREVMLYSLDRSTPADSLQKIPHEEIKRIASLMEKEGINVAPF